MSSLHEACLWATKIRPMSITIQHKPHYLRVTNFFSIPKKGQHVTCYWKALEDGSKRCHKLTFCGDQKNLITRVAIRTTINFFQLPSDIPPLSDGNWNFSVAKDGPSRDIWFFKNDITCSPLPFSDQKISIAIWYTPTIGWQPKLFNR